MRSLLIKDTCLVACLHSVYLKCVHFILPLRMGRFTAYEEFNQQERRSTARLLYEIRYVALQLETRCTFTAHEGSLSSITAETSVSLRDMTRQTICCILSHETRHTYVKNEATLGPRIAPKRKNYILFRNPLYVLFLHYSATHCIT